MAGEPRTAESALAEAIHDACDWEHYMGHEANERDEMLAASLIPALERRGFRLALRAESPEVGRLDVDAAVAVEALSLLENYGAHHEWCPQKGPDPNCECRYIAATNELRAKVDAAALRATPSPVPRFDMDQDDSQQPPWDHAYEAGPDNICVTCGHIGSFAHTPEFYRATPSPVPHEPRLCDCTLDAELGAGSVCPRCHHRDHGASGCGVRLHPAWPGADRTPETP